MLIFESLLVLSLAFDPDEIMLLVSDAILLINFSPGEVVWPIPDVTIASRGTLFDPRTEFDQFKRSSDRWPYSGLCRFAVLRMVMRRGLEDASAV